VEETLEALRVALHHFRERAGQLAAEVEAEHAAQARGAEGDGRIACLPREPAHEGGRRGAETVEESGL